MMIGQLHVPELQLENNLMRTASETLPLPPSVLCAVQESGARQRALLHSGSQRSGAGPNNYEKKRPANYLRRSPTLNSLQEFKTPVTSCRNYFARPPHLKPA